MYSLNVGCVAASRALGSAWFPRREFLKVTSSGSGRHFSLYQTRFNQSTAKQEEIAVIRVPRYLQKTVQDVKHTRGKDQIPISKAGKLLIQSRNPVFNQSAGYILAKFEQPNLSSKGWKHNKSFGDYFTINNTKTVAPFFSSKQHEDTEQKAPPSFQKFHLCKELLETLNSNNITVPTTVQLQTIPKVMKGHNIVCAAETGSGKTLSYLLPIVQRLQADRQQSQSLDGDEDKLSALILVPSRELAEQVCAVSRALCVPFGFQTKILGGGQGIGHIKNVFKNDPADILVSTPGALVKALRRRLLFLNDLDFFVVDEADTMFDPSFSGMLDDILSHASIASGRKETEGLDRKAQLLVVGATFPGGVGELLSKVTDLGAMVVIKSKMLHFLMPHVKQRFLKVNGADKVLELHQALKQLESSGVALVFCNKSSTVNFVGYSLDELGMKHTRLQGAMPAVVRSGIFKSFQKGDVDVLVCTDIASRGLDTSRVHLVVNYDFPESQTDYIHRAGRVGRAGGIEDVEVLSFVTHPWDVELVQKIESAARRRMSLPGMESEIQQPKPKPKDSDSEL